MEFMNPIFLKLKQNGKSIYDILTKPKVVKISIYISLLIFLPGLITGIIVAINFGALGYNLWFNWISDLGSLLYTPAPFILDLTCIISAIFIVPLILNLSRLYSSHQNHKLDNSKKEHYIILFRRIFGYIGVGALFIGVIGMFFVGVFSLDRSPFDLHFYFSTSAFGGFAVGAFFTGLAIVLRKRIFPKTVGYFMIFGPSTASIIFLLCPAPLTRQFLEWILMFSSLGWYYVIVFITLQKLNTLLFFNPDFKW
jgi:hydrogenase-4 membrane subunit HyfE